MMNTDLNKQIHVSMRGCATYEVVTWPYWHGMMQLWASNMHAHEQPAPARSPTHMHTSSEQPAPARSPHAYAHEQPGPARSPHAHVHEQPGPAYEQPGEVGAT